MLAPRSASDGGRFRRCPSLPPGPPHCSGIDHHLIVPRVESRPFLGRGRATAVSELHELGEEQVALDPRREQGEEGRPLVAVVAEAVCPPSCTRAKSPEP